MTLSDDVLRYGEQLIEEVESAAGREPFDDQLALFTTRSAEIIREVGAISDFQPLFFSKHFDGKQLDINGYNLNEEEGVLDLFVCSFDGEPARTVSATVISNRVQAAVDFFLASSSGKLLPELESGLEQDELPKRIFELTKSGTIKKVQVFFCVNGIAAKTTKATEPKLPRSGPKLAVHVWDLERFQRSETGGGAREVIELDFASDFGGAIPCLKMEHSTSKEYDSYLAIFPGDTLAELYDRYGEQLLELNVRSFLQARGKVNAGIQETIKNAPEFFFAYNNGLSATAEEIETVRTSAGIAIKSARGFQIVNGGQTTASLHHARERVGIELKGIAVQAKISVVRKEHLDILVPRISRYANSQNKVNDSDLMANEEIHLRIERLSRTVWAGDQQSQWFYERARGQYQVARAKASTSASDRKRFEAKYPPSRMFTKTDVAAVSNLWDGLPHIVGRGGQKNFKAFSELHDDAEAERLEASDFKDLIAKLIIFRAAQQVIKENAKQFPAYRANIVAYSVAYLAKAAKRDIDYAGIYRTASVPAGMTEAILDIARVVGPMIKETAGSRNVTEWTKQEACWKEISREKIDFTRSFKVATSVAPAKTGARLAARSEREDRAWLTEELAEHDIIDCRSAGGPLYVLGGAKLSKLMARVERRGFRTKVFKAGNKDTDGKPAWGIWPKAD